MHVQLIKPAKQERHVVLAPTLEMDFVMIITITAVVDGIKEIAVERAVNQINTNYARHACA
jgi:hypothetical protein